MSRILNSILSFILLLASMSVQSYTCSFRGLSLSDGLSDLLINAIYKDSLGYVWLGTGTSLDRFDGVHLEHYAIAGGNEKLKRVQAIAEMPGHELWMGNGMGLWRLNRGQNQLEQVVSESINFEVHALLCMDGVLYVGTEKGLFIYEDGRFSRLLLDDNVLAASNAVMEMCEGDDGLLWLATKNGLCSVHLPDRRVQFYHNVVADKHVCAFHHIARIGKVLYLGTMEQGIVSFDTRTHAFAPYLGVNCNVISSLSSDGKRMLYVGTDGNGVHFIDVERHAIVSSMRHEAGNDGQLRSNSVYSLLVDRDGIVWVGYYQSGLDYTLYQTDLFAIYSCSGLFSSKDLPVRAIVINGPEKLIGSRDGFSYIDERTHVVKNFKAPQMRSSMVFCIQPYQGKYYIGTYGGGMYVFDAASQALRDFEPDERMPFQKGHIFCMREDADGKLWIGTSSGLFCYDGDRPVAHYTNANSQLPEGNVYEIFFDSTHKGWICTENGLCVWDPSAGKLRTDIFPDGFIDKEKVRVVYEDSAHRLYFLPDKGPMFISDLSMTDFHRLQPGTPLEGKDGYFIIEDAGGWLWIGTSNGLFHYDKQDNFMPYNFVDGIPSPVFTLCLPVIDATGRLWMGNTKGLVYVDLNEVDTQIPCSYPMQVTGIYADGKTPIHPSADRIDGERMVRLADSQRNITFHFSDFTYSAPASMAYEYMLEGRDDGWMSVTGRSEASYYSLPSGTYVFKVRCMGNPHTETRLAIHIASPAILRYVAAGVLLLMLFAIGYRYGRKRHAVPAVVPDTVARPAAGEQVAAHSVTVAEEPRQVSAEEKYKTAKVSAEECKRLADRLDKLMRKQKPYTKPDLKIAELAAMLDTSAHTLSYLFNQYLNRNYYDYINDFRISEFKQLVGKDTSSKYTLTALAELCGFSSRASFFRYFKKATGITPSEYIQQLGRTE